MNLDLLENSIKYNGKALFDLILNKNSKEEEKEKRGEAEIINIDKPNDNLLFYSDEDKVVKKLDKVENSDFTK